MKIHIFIVMESQWGRGLSLLFQSHYCMYGTPEYAVERQVPFPGEISGARAAVSQGKTMLGGREV